MLLNILQYTAPTIKDYLADYVSSAKDEKPEYSNYLSSTLLTAAYLELLCFLVIEVS